jgi:glycosyltransferase involved in cell wall biosynthesis
VQPSAAQPTFSVVVAAFNSESRIAETMLSVLGQSRPDLELIVVDDGSTDATAAVAERIATGDERARVIRQPNQGTVAARNAGLAAAGGRYVSFLDDDDLWLPSYLERVASGFERVDDAGLVHSDAWVLDADSGRFGRLTAHQRFAWPIRRLPSAPAPRQAEEALLRVNFVTTCAATVSARALGSVGALEPAIRGCDDWDLWLRIVGAGYRPLRIDEPLAVLRKRGESVGSDSAMMARNSRLVLERALERGVRGRRAERRARRHIRAIDRELAAMSGGSPLRRRVARARRRLGRKRLRVPGRQWRPAPPEVQVTLDRLAAAAGAQSESGSAADRG